MPVYSLHIGGQLNLWERCSLQSFADHGHEIALYAYESLDLPSGVRLARADDIVRDGERKAFFEAAPGAISQFSDLFRYEMLARHGGWWVDTDVICLTDTLPDTEVWIARGSRRVYGGVMRFPAGHAMMREAASASRQRTGSLTTLRRSAIGPVMMTDLIKRYPIPIHGRDACYKIPPGRAVEFGELDYAAALRNELSGCLMLHWWAGRFRGGDFPPNVLPPRGSYLAELFTAHGGEGAPHLELDEWRERLLRGAEAHKASKSRHAAVKPKWGIHKVVGRLKGFVRRAASELWCNQRH